VFLEFASKSRETIRLPNVNWQRVPDIIVYVYLSLVVFVVIFVFCSISFSTLILLVGSFDL